MNTSTTELWQPGNTNLITDVPGLQVGNASDAAMKTGVTLVTSDQPFSASVDVMGGAPGSRETELLAPDKLVSEVDAIVLSGGSAFGLDAASGVTDALRQAQRGFSVGPVRVPIVPAAIIFDLLNGGDHGWTKNPYSQLGAQAFADRATHFELGSVGAGTGATTASFKGGLGSASLVLPNGLVVGALVVANPHGHVTMGNTEHFWAAPFEMHDEFGGLGSAPHVDPHVIPVNNKFRAYVERYGTPGDASPSPHGGNTTIGIVASNAVMTKAQLKRMAVAAQDGMSRAIVPSHTPFDGDMVFSVASNQQPLLDEAHEAMLLGHAAALCLARAISRAVYHAVAAPGDTLPTWRSTFRGST